MVYAATLSESQRVMRWRLILEDSGPNIQNIAGVENIVAYTIIILPSMPNNKCDPCTKKPQCHANGFFAIGRIGNN